MVELRHAYRERMRDLEDSLLAMGSQVLEMLDAAVEALYQRDPNAAAAILAADDALDDRARAVQETTLRTLALQAPVAAELRLVAAVVHINIRLERMGDLCINIARAAAHFQDLEHDEALLQHVREMATLARRLCGQAFEAFANRDLDRARGLADLDDTLDTLNEGLILRLLREGAGDEAKLDRAVRLVLVARNLERMGDHAVGIGQQTIFAVTGERV